MPSSFVNSKQSGFTLVEVIVATAIFAVVISSILVLFNSVIRINREVQAKRQVAQAARNFTEVLSREIRNGKIDYLASAPCAATNYSSASNQSLAIITYSGERLCFYLNTSQKTLILRRETSTVRTEESINPQNLTIDPTTFRFIVRPTTNPLSSNKGVQPMVTILANFKVYEGLRDEASIPYQTTISTDVYDIPHL